MLIKNPLNGSEDTFRSSVQFIANGPNIPDALLRAQEDGRLVSFCGAGISAPAGLPLFDKLVDKIYEYLHEYQDETEKYHYDKESYDIVLNLLEKRLANGKNGIHGTLSEALKANLDSKGAIETHEALLELARCDNRSFRLVTTNFDRIFEHVIKVGESWKKRIQRYQAPFLPIPKAESWQGLVYLHGLLSAEEDPENQELVLTSGDFGRAYLTER